MRLAGQKAFYDRLNLTAQHALVAGKTGSGKSTLLHALITQLALNYSPDEVELYLVDFKKGVEFKTYATHGLPHARAIADRLRLPSRMVAQWIAEAEPLFSLNEKDQS